MGTLRIYGDSFSADLGLDWQYIHQLARYLDMPMVNTSLFGCANEWIIKNLIYDIIYDQIKPDDFVLIVTTSETREWLFKDIPDIGNFQGISDLDRSLTPQEMAALKSYVIHLHNPSLNIQRHLANSALIKSLTTAIESKGTRTMVIPGFYNCNPSKESAKWINDYIFKHSPDQGCLNDVCMNEFDEFETTGLKWYKTYALPDLRANHLLKQNHNILFEKIVDSIENNTTLDLTSGFISGVITSNKLHQYWSYKEETVDIGFWNKTTSADNLVHMRKLLKRLEELETLDEALPFFRSQMH